MATKIVEGDDDAKATDAIAGSIVTAVPALPETERAERPLEPSVAQRPALRLVQGHRCKRGQDASPRFSADMLYSLAREGCNHPAWQSVIEPWLETEAPTSRGGDNVRRCLMRKMIRQRIGATGSIAKLTLIEGGKRD